MPGQVIRILSTRPLHASLKKLAGEKGIVIDDIPFIETIPLHEEPLLQKIRELSQRPLTVVFTSMNAVEAVAAQAHQPSPWKIFSIGAATRTLAEQYFGKDNIDGTAPSAAELAEEILRRHTVHEIFFFCGDQRRDELPDRLRQGGIKVNEIVVYRTVQKAHKTAASYNGVVFFSPSAVQSFFSINKVPPATILFAIGRTTAGVLKEYSANTIITAEAPEKEALIKQVIDHFQTRL